MDINKLKSLAGELKTAPIDAKDYFNDFIDTSLVETNGAEKSKIFSVHVGQKNEQASEHNEILLAPNSFFIEIQEHNQKDKIKSDLSKVEKALDLAHDIRKFEIELFWKRATFFWTLLAATIITFGAIISAKDLDPAIRWGLLTLISFAGCIAAAVLLFANKGSKFWQRNWEYQVDMLEDPITGPLYKTVISRQPGTYFSRFDIASSYNFSVSALANILAWLFLVVFIIFLAITSFRFSIAIQSELLTIELLDPKLLLGSLCTILVVSFCLLLIHWVSNFGEMSTKLKQEPDHETPPKLEAKSNQVTKDSSESKNQNNESNSVKLMISRRKII